LTEPITLPVVSQILVSHRPKVDKANVKSVIENIIKEHSPKGHHFEVAWALWICKEFEIALSDSIGELVLNSNDVVSILIALDLKKTGFIKSTVSTSNIESDLTPESLMDEKWLLTYEAITQDWVSTTGFKTINDNEYFNILRKHNVQFYDNNKRVIPFELERPNVKKLKQTTTPTDVEYRYDVY
jgi:hypothetical protein